MHNYAMKKFFCSSDAAHQLMRRTRGYEKSAWLLREDKYVCQKWTQSYDIKTLDVQIEGLQRASVLRKCMLLGEGDMRTE